MTTTAIAKNIDAAQPATAARLAPQVDPANVTLDFNGQVRRAFFVRLPQGFTADDLKETTAWRRVQAAMAKSLRKHDALYVVGFDESWAGEATVGSADSAGVALAGVKIMQLPVRTRRMLEDENFRIVWTGVGYRVQRKKDDQYVTQATASEKLAERDLENQYPKRLGA